MRIKNIQIKNFRNYPELDLSITNDVVVLSGPNAVGKTNLLESIYFASLFKSFRDDTEYIFLKDQDSAEIRIQIEKNNEDVLLEVFLAKRDKVYANFQINGVKKKRKEAQGFMRVVIFDPTDVDMFSKTPDSRRKYLNMVLSQKSKQYLDLIGSYKKILYQKTRLLQDIRLNQGSLTTLDSWNKQLVEVGSKIIFERKAFINYLNQNIAEVYSAISGFHRPIEVSYETLTGESQLDIQNALEQKLQNYQQKEIASGACLAGPHRDDFFLKSDGLFLSPFSSRGELRGQVLALKILELEYLSQEGDKPVLLLDDVLSELDETRRMFLLKYLQGKFQTFITTTHPLEMPAQHITLTPAVVEEDRGE